MKTEILEKLGQEQKELDIKVEKLTKFLESEAIEKVTSNHLNILQIQLSAMITYSSCLTARIDDLKSEL